MIAPVVVAFRRNAATTITLGAASIESPSHSQLRFDTGLLLLASDPERHCKFPVTPLAAASGGAVPRVQSPSGGPDTFAPFRCSGRTRQTARPGAGP